MSNKYISNLKKNYIHQIRPLKMVSEVIRDLDLIPLKESELNVLEAPHFRFLRENYRSAFNTDPSTIEFHFFLLKKSEKSKYYYDLMENKDERIIIVTESKENFIISNCQLLSLDLQIDRGLDSRYMDTDSVELMAYLSLFEFRDSMK